ncbi:MAG: ABC transporter permease [Lachnospiraceae bacterium]|nr:ABC transporter permease [Lachnospiraceae bacterium]
MNLKILKKDLKRKKSMNFILLLFVILATTFIAASVNNMKIITTGLDNYFEMSGVCDYLINTMSGMNGEPTDNDLRIEEFLEDSELVSHYEVDDGLMIFENQLEDMGDSQLKIDSTFAVFSIESNQQNYFDENNQILTEIQAGEMYIPKKLLSDTFQVGDSIYIKSGDYKKKFTIKGTVKDIILGGELMGMNRVLVGQKDFDELVKHGEFVSQKMYGVYTEDVDAFYQEYVDKGFYILFNGDMDLIRTTYFVDMMVAAILLAVSICLILISAVMLRFTILFTVNEDYKEIGIMKAIGIPEKAIRSLYVVKYLVISVVGAIIGFFVSIPFTDLLVSNVVKNIVVEMGNNNYITAGITSMAVVLVIVWFAYLSTGRIKKATPMDAIRSGNNGERFAKKSVFSMSKTGMRPTTFMAINDVLCELKKYIVLVLTGMIGVWLVVMLVNTINTLQSEKIAAWFALAPCDFFILEQSRVEENVALANRQVYEDYLEELKGRLEDIDVDVDHTFTEVVLKYKISKGDLSYNSMALMGLGADTEVYMYDEGVAPKEKNEVAITHMVAEKIDAQIGDTVYVNMYGEERPFIVTAVYQSMNNMGEGIRFAETADVDFAAISGAFGVQVVLDGDMSKEEVLDTIDKVSKEMPEAEIETTQEFLDDMIGGISDMLKSVKTLIMTIVIIINILAMVLMQKMFLIREQGEIGMLKAIGFSNASLISWQTKRMALVLLVGVLLGVVTGTPVTQLTSGQVFKYMGASKIEFVINPLEIYVLYPVAIWVVTVVACMITMLQVRKVDVDSIKEIE